MKESPDKFVDFFLVLVFFDRDQKTRVIPVVGISLYNTTTTRILNDTLESISIYRTEFGFFSSLSLF